VNLTEDLDRKWSRALAWLEQLDSAEDSRSGAVRDALGPIAAARQSRALHEEAVDMCLKIENAHWISVKAIEARMNEDLGRTGEVRRKRGLFDPPG